MKSTWVALLLEQAETLGEKTAFRFLLDGGRGGASESLSYAALAQRAAAIGTELAQRGGRGARVLLLYPPGLGFIEAFFGTLFAGAVAVPLQPPERGGQQQFAARLERVMADAEAEFVLSDAATLAQIAPLLPDRPNLQWLDSTAVPSAHAAFWRAPELTAQDPALLQYTSGSTAAPRGVRISHANLSANCASISQAGFGDGERPLHVGWMPHYHDMGLIGDRLCPLYLGITSVLMAPQSFIKAPLKWLQAVSRFGAASSGGPSFAYELALRRTSADERRALDLSSWQVAYCGAEPIREKVLQRFADAFAPAGFRRDSFLCCYGMAESTLFVTGRRGLQYLSLDRQALAGHRIEPSVGAAAQNIVSCGRPGSGTEVRIVTDGRALPENKVGEIWIKGPGVASGYYRAAGGDQAFGAKLGGETGFLRSGDLGFRHRDELYVCGRLKELIIIRGQNLYPQALEQTAETVDAALTPGSVAAFAWDADGTESFGVLAGIRGGGHESAALTALAQRLSSAIVAAHGVQPAFVKLVRAAEIPKTSSGKIRRTACRSMLLNGEFTVLAETPTAQKSLYTGLDKTFAKLDRRNTNYQFDLERDIAWAHCDAGGRYFSDTMLYSFGFEPERFRDYREELGVFEQLLALMICRQFVDLEEFVLQWGTALHTAGAATRSLQLLEDEEAKHVAVFRRYSAVLSAACPNHGDAQAVLGQTVLREFLAWAIDPGLYRSPAEYHYSVWLGILFFEEYTLWMGDMLGAAGAEVQVTWRQAHACHRREESQHVVTDAAYIKALNTRFEQRQRWSERLFKQLIEVTTLEFREVAALVEARFPHLPRPLMRPLSGSVMLPVLRHRAFVHTRALAPYAAYLCSDAAPQPTPGIWLTAVDFKTWLRGVLADILGCERQKISDAAEFSHLGLDSLGHLSLIAALEKRLQRPVPSNLTLLHASIDALSDFLILHGGETPAAAEDLGRAALQPRPRSAAVPANALQRRFLQQGRELERAPLVYMIAPCDAPLEPALLQRAVALLAERHESLRSAFRIQQDELYSVPNIAVAVETLMLADGDPLVQLRRQLLSWNAQGFDVQQPPLWRVALLRQAERSWIVWRLHCLICDGWSAEILREELLETYRTLAAERVLEQPGATLQQADVCVWEQDFVRGAEAARRLLWWQAQPATRAARSNPERDAGRHALAVRYGSPQLKSAFYAAAKRYRTTPAVLLLTVFARLIGDRCGDGYIVSRFFNRATEAERRLVGLMVDGLLLPRQREGDWPTALQHTRAALQAALSHYLPLQYLAAGLLGEDFLQSRKNLGPVLNFIAFTERSAARDGINMLMDAELYLPFLPWEREVLYVWMARDGIGFSLAYDGAAGAAWGETLLDEFVSSLQTACRASPLPEKVTAAPAS